MKDHLLQTVRTQPVERRSNLAREYLQLYLLRLMHDAGSTDDLAFVGGTALRLLYRLPRFSEDLDFCHEPLPKRAKFDVARLFDTIERGLSKASYDVTVKAKPERTVANAFFRFQGIPLDWKAVVADLRPFVERQGDLDVLSKEAIHKLLEDR